MYAGISANIVLKNNLETDFRFAFMGGLPDIYITARYYPFKNLGLNFGFFSNGFEMNRFSDFHKQNENKMYGDLNTNYRQHFPVNNGFLDGINYRIHFWRVNSVLKMDAGFSSIHPFSVSVVQKEKAGNYKRKIDYETKRHFDFFIYPALELDVNCFKMKTQITKIFVPLLPNPALDEVLKPLLIVNYHWLKNVIHLEFDKNSAFYTAFRNIKF